MKITTLDINNPLWNETLSKLNHDVYHLPEYVKLDSQRTNTKPEAFLLEDGDNIFFAPYLLRSCSDIVTGETSDLYDVISPYGYSGILMNEAAMSNPEFPDFALIQFKQQLKQRGVCSAFLRLHPILGEKFSQVFQTDPLTKSGQTVSIDLNLSEEQIWAKTRRGHQSTINKCMRLGLSAKIVPYADFIDEFIDIYEETMNRVKAKDSYYFSRDYFKGLLNLGDQVHLGVVESESQIVCVCLFFESCGIVQAHLGGTRTEFLKQSPFNLLLHHTRLWAKDRGNTYLHIGGGVGGNKDNLYTFKSGFSKQRHDFLTLRSVVNNAKYDDLLEFRANSVNKSVEELIQSEFFPAYRAS